MKKFLPFTCMAAGALAYLAVGFALARLPLVRSYWFYFIPAGFACLGLIGALGWLEGQGKQPYEGSALKRFGLGALSALAGLVLAWVLVFGLGRLSYSSSLAKVKASGFYEELPANDIEDKTFKNGRMILEAWTDDKKLQDKFGKKDGMATLVGNALNGKPGALEALRKRRGELKGALDAVDKAAAAPVFSWNIKYDVPYYSIEMPRYAGLLNVGRALAGEALLLQAEGKPDQAEARLLQGCWISGKLSQSPTLVSSMIRVAFESNLFKAAVPLLARGKGARFAAALNAGQEAAMHRALALDFFKGPESVRQMTLKEFTGGLNLFSDHLPGRIVSLLYQPWVNLDLAAGLQDNLAFMHCTKKPPLECGACMGSISDKIWRTGWFLQSLAVPQLSPLYYKSVAGTARSRMAALSLLAGQYKSKHKRWPADAATLDPSGQYNDPFTQKPFLTRMKDGRFEIVCLGADGEEGDKPKIGGGEDIFAQF